MKKFVVASLVCVMSAYVLPAVAVDTTASNAVVQKIRTLSFRKCAEQSKIGKREQANFEALKKQMEGVLMEKEKTLNEIATKLEDPDYVDSLSPEAETEMNRKFRGMSQELLQLRQQYLQALQQTNFKVLQSLSEEVTKATKQLATKLNVDLVLNDESAFYANPVLDISEEVIRILDQLFDQEAVAPTSEGSKK